MSESQRAMLRSHGTLVGRVLMGLLFFFSGVGMLMTPGGMEGTASMIMNAGLPLAGLLAWLVLAVKLFGGASLILGYRVGCGAFLLLGFTALATLFFHLDINDHGLFKNLAIMGGLLYVMAYGPGEGWAMKR